MKIKTILIPIFQGVEARNILRTDIFKKLREQKDIKIVLLVSNEYKLEYYKKEFGEDNLLKFEIFDDFKKSFLEKLFSKFKIYLLNTETMDIKRKLRLHDSKNYPRYLVSFVFNRIIARPFFIKVARFLDYYLIKDNNFKNLFDKYNPNLVFLAHLFGDIEISILREAKKRNIKTVGFINSWDKLTSRCILRISPDWLIVPNEITKKEAIKYQNIDEKSIFVSGPPQFDIYKQYANYSKREDFCKKHNIDPSKKIILFCPLGSTFSNFDWLTIEMLNDLYQNREIPQDIHFIVRFPPNDIVNIKDNIDKSIFSFQTPGIRFSSKRGIDWDMNEEDVKLLIDTVHHSSLVICFPSTISIDASILDRPVMNVNFLYDKRFNMEGLFHYYQMTHYKELLKHNGIKLVKNKEELTDTINKYLENPNLNKEGRMSIVNEQVWKFDGKAGERVANFLVKLIK
ncbi:MAG: CDP-glycerol glycerophosphotransferase family protein [Candidatus Paceibacterota bacterium]